MSAAAPSMHSEAAQRVATRLGLRLGPPNLEVFAATLSELAKADPAVLAVTSDSRGSGKLGPFGKAFPSQLVEVGIAEQALVGVSAGLAAAGRTVFAVSPACFLTARSLEQIKTDVAYADRPVVLVGISAGVSYGALGSTHHSLHDFAVLRAINNIAILAPADAAEARSAILAAARARRPTYVRFGKGPLYGLPSGEPLSSGSSPFLPVRRLCEGRDAALIATGETVIHALLAAAFLGESGVHCRVLSVPTIKPLNAAAILAAARECSAVVTVEEHMEHGGLGEACAAVIAQAGIAVPFRIAAIPDEYTVTGSQADIFRHYGLTMEGLARTAREALAGRAAHA